MSGFISGPTPLEWTLRVSYLSKTHRHSAGQQTFKEVNMRRSVLLLSAVVATVLLSAQLSNFSQYAAVQKGQERGQIIDEVPAVAEYISPGDRHKLRLSDRSAVNMPDQAEKSKVKFPNRVDCKT